MLERIALALALIAVAATAQAQSNLTVAMPEGWNPLAHAEIADCLADLLARAHLGAGAEQAAFIVLRNDGSFSCVPWKQNRATSHGAAFRGNVPDGTVAVAHTHPFGHANPSHQDTREAKRLDVPFIVVSWGMVTMARAHDGVIVTLTASSEPSRFRPSDLSPR